MYAPLVQTRRNGSYLCHFLDHCLKLLIITPSMYDHISVNKNFSLSEKFRLIFWNTKFTNNLSLHWLCKCNNLAVTIDLQTLLPGIELLIKIVWKHFCISFLKPFSEQIDLGFMHCIYPSFWKNMKKIKKIT